MNSDCLFSSETDLWATPPEVFASIAKRFGPFDLDVCAVADNAKCERYYSPEQDGLQQPWRGRCWMNPPYGRGIGQWVRKAWEASVGGATVVCLLPARTDTRWWHEYIAPYASKIEFIRGRLRFGGAENGTPFPSVIVLFAPAAQRRCQWCERPFVPRRTDSKFCGGACKQAAYRARRVTALSVTEGATAV